MKQKIKLRKKIIRLKSKEKKVLKEKKMCQN